MASIQALIWDLGGTILRTYDSAPRTQIAEAYGTTRQELEKLVFESDTAMAATLGNIPEDVHWQAVFERLKVLQPDQAIFRQQFWAGDRVDESLVTWIRELRLRYRTGLLSNAWSDARRDIGGRYHFLHVFDDSIFSAEVHLAKPDPAIYKLAAGRLGVHPEKCLFIDDVASNIEGARNAGMTAIQFKNYKQVHQKVTILLLH